MTRDDVPDLDALDLDPRITAMTRHSIEHAQAVGLLMRSYPPSDRLEVATSDHVAFAFDTLIARLNNPEGKACTSEHCFCPMRG